MMSLTDANGRICRFPVLPGNASEGKALPALLDGVHAYEVIGDKAYDSNAIRQMLASRNIICTIPSLANRRFIVWYGPNHYPGRHPVENRLDDPKESLGVGLGSPTWRTASRRS